MQLGIRVKAMEQMETLPRKMLQLVLAKALMN